MKLRTGMLMGAVGLTTALSLSMTGTAQAADAHNTVNAAMPGGSGYVTCTTDYNVSTSGRSVQPVKTYCTNRTNRTLTWTQSVWTETDGGELKLVSYITLSPNSVSTRWWTSTSVPYVAKVNQPTISSRFVWGNYSLIINNKMY